MDKTFSFFDCKSNSKRPLFLLEGNQSKCLSYVFSIHNVTLADENRNCQRDAVFEMVIVCHT